MPPSNEPNRSSCSARFREMLSCVETTGKAACTPIINDFLACERAVIRTALAKHPPSTTSSPSIPGLSPESENNPPSQQTAPTPPTEPPQSAKSVQQMHARNHSQPFVGPSEMLRKILDKQLAASSALIASFRGKDFFPAFGSFSRRMIADARLTCSVVGGKAAKVLNGMWDRRSDGAD